MEILGWREWVGLPELRVMAIKVKVDSGAKTSALHAEDIVITRNPRTGARSVRFTLYPRKNRAKPLVGRAPLVGYRKVRSSVGHETERPVIQTLLRLDGQEWPIEVTLINRDIMGFRMLLGRSALKPGLLIDPTQSYLLPRPRRSKVAP
ncbi:MAG: ATP-dependent zinc protease [Bdellovibrionales bacterium]